jgi:uncharacterized Zn-binding protein involved in type VI secretion
MPSISVSGDTSVHGGAPLDTGLSSDVFAGGKKVALLGSGSSSPDSQYDSRNRPVHNAGNQTTKQGSTTVFVNGKALHRVNDARLEGTTSGPGIATILVGGPGGASTVGSAPAAPAGSSIPDGQPPGLIGAFDPNLFIANGTNGYPMPRANAVPGKDYTYREDGNGGYLLINLNSFTPNVTERVTSVYGDTPQGITRTWTIPGLPEETFQTNQPAPLAVLNPPLDAFSNLPLDQRREIVNNYCTQNNLNGLVGGGDAGPTASPGYAESTAFRDFLVSQGINGPGDTTGEYTG